MAIDETDNRSDHRHCFDFEIGYLVKSPCRECEHRTCLPACIDSCRILARIHERLSKVISCSARHS